jgi:putative ATPase
LHIACAPKSNSVTLGLAAAKQALNSQPVQSVPVALRDKGGKANKLLGHGKGYLYAHDFAENIAPQAYLEKPLELFTPKIAGIEAKLAERLARWREMRAKMLRS